MIVIEIQQGKYYIVNTTTYVLYKDQIYQDTCHILHNHHKIFQNRLIEGDQLYMRQCDL